MSQDNTEVDQKDQTASSDQQAVETKDSNAAGDQDQAIDYKAELAKVTTDRDNYKQGMLNAKDKLDKIQSKKEEKEDDSEDDDIDAKIDAKVNERLADITKKVDINTFDSLISDYSNNTDEQALIKYHFENSVSGALPIRDRIENAKLIANKAAILKTNSELATALKSKMGVSKINTASGGNQDHEKVSKEFFSPEQLATLKKRGLDPKVVEENFKKLTQK